MKIAYSSLGVFLSISVLFSSLATGQPQQRTCPDPRCSKCGPVHDMFNGSMSEFIAAFCHYIKGEKMTSIPQNLPSRLGILRMTSHNVRVLERGSLQKYLYLYKLYLEQNGLQRIQTRAFFQQKFLIELDLHGNMLINISAETFRGLTSLRKLRLDHNKLQKIPRGTFVSVPSIEYIDLRFNSISLLEEGAFDELDYLKTLLLSSNQLRRINRGALGNLMSLTRLELTSNHIQGIDESVFSCAPLVKELVLRDNQLGRIPKESIGDLRFLALFDISQNPVSYIESNALIGVKSLKEINLNDCNISGIQNGAFYWLQKITTVHLKNNPLKCDCHLSWISRWLSRNPEVLFEGAVCQAPRDISGQNVSSANLQSFICTCADCTEDASCNKGNWPTNCSCSKNWTGLSCNDTCQSHNKTVQCRKFGGTCFCESKVLFQKTKKHPNCSFNTTSEKCSEHGEVVKDGAHLECVCKKGFLGNGINCTDMDECKTGRGFCHLHAHCINTLGSYKCECHKGFRDLLNGQGMLCREIDECTEEEPCDLHANCHNNPGSYACTCFSGYTGNGKTCFPVPDKPVQLTVTEIKPSEVTVAWSVTNTTIIRNFTVEYKGLGIHGREWAVIVLQPHETQTHLKDLESDSTYLVRIGAFSIFNTSIYSDEKMFATAAISKEPSTARSSTSDPQNTIVIAVALVVSIALLAMIAVVLYFLMKRRKQQKSNNALPQYVPGLEDLIEMRTRTHSGGTESRGNRDLLEIGSTLHSFTSCAVDNNDEWEISRDLLVVGQKIGEGQFGLVLVGTLMTEEGPIKVAVKTIKENADRFDIKDLLQEMEMMKEIGQHPHVVSLMGTCTTPGPLYIITEYVSGGNLLDYLRASRPADETYVNVTSTLSSRDLVKIALDCARGMNHIANKKFVHRDLAARNILLTEDYEAKVADFGLARDIYGDGQYVKTGGGRLPIKWMAPECIQDQIYTTMSDVWSFGVLLWEIVTIGSAPYPCVPVNLLLSKLLCGYRMSKPAHCSDELYDLMTRCWLLDPDARPKFPELCHTLSEMLSESARSYVNVTVSDERVGPMEEDCDNAHEQTTSV